MHITVGKIYPQPRKSGISEIYPTNDVSARSHVSMTTNIVTINIR
jgi:hypothetical protein